MCVRVRLLGQPAVEVADGTPRPHPRGHKTWLLLARTALTEVGVSRTQLAEELFDDAVDPMAALRWVLADARRVLGMPDVLRGNPLRLEAADLWIDVRALEAGEPLDRELGPILLEGVDTRSAPGIEMWLSLARAHVSAITSQQVRERALDCLAAGDAETAVRLARIAATAEPLDEQVQELLLRSLVAAGHVGAAAAHLSVCEATFAREGLSASPALRAAAQGPRRDWQQGLRAAVVARSLVRAGAAALDAGAADAGVETLRRAVVEAERSGDDGLIADAAKALGAALVHAVRGYDGEGALVLHQAIRAAKAGGRRDVEADALRELAFIDVQAGRHTAATTALTRATALADEVQDPRLSAGILAVAGMNEADRGHHSRAIALLEQSASAAATTGASRQQAWSLGVLARSALLSGDAARAAQTACQSIELAGAQRWNSFLPWPMSLHAECLSLAGRWDDAAHQAEQAFALGCQLGDPCWEAMSARMLGLVAQHRGESADARRWIDEARTRNDRVTDRYVWISCFTALTRIQLEERTDPAAAARLAARLYDDAVRVGLPGFAAWALTYRGAGDPTVGGLAREIAADVEEPALHERIGEVFGAEQPDPGSSRPR